MTTMYPRLSIPVLALTSQRAALILAVLGSAGILAGIHLFDWIVALPPCKLCYYQRYAYWLALGLASAGGLVPVSGLPPQKWERTERIFVALALGALLAGGGVAAYHVGVEQGFWPGPTACSGGAALPDTLTDLNSLFAEDATAAACDEVPWSFMGLSLAALNLIYALGLSIAVAWLWLADPLKAKDTGARVARQDAH